MITRLDCRQHMLMSRFASRETFGLVTWTTGNTHCSCALGLNQGTRMEQNFPWLRHLCRVKLNSKDESGCKNQFSLTIHNWIIILKEAKHFVGRSYSMQFPGILSPVLLPSSFLEKNRKAAVLQEFWFAKHSLLLSAYPTAAENILTDYLWRCLVPLWDRGWEAASLLQAPSAGNFWNSQTCLRNLWC